jgi:hypothetical protein
MTEDLLIKSSMDVDEDLLTRIQREMHERLRELRAAIDEHDRLQADLSVLDMAPEQPEDLEPIAALKAVPELSVGSKPSAALDTDSELSVAPEAVPEPSVAPEPSAKVVRLPTRSRLSRTRTVSPKITRLMRAPRRPALERAGVVRVGAGRLDSSTEVPVDELDADAEVYERPL